MQFKLKKIKTTTDDTPSVMPGMNQEMPLDAPSFYISDKQMPEIRDWEVGEKYQLVIDVVQKSKREDKRKDVEASFDIVGYKVLPKKDYENMTDKEFEIEQAKGLSVKK